MITLSVSRIGALCSSAVLLSQLSASGQLYSDDFQADSSANWSIYGISANGMTTDYSAQFAFDYSTQAYRFNGVTNFVPASPNSGGTTKGLKVTVNKNGNTSPAAVSLYPNGQSFSGNYSLKFDLWMDYSGDIPFGNGGSTEFASFGLNHLGTQVNWPNSPQNGDGVWFAVSGEGGSGRDYRAYVGDSTPGPNTELIGSGGFLDRDGDTTPEQAVPNDGSFTPLQYLFPAPPGQTAGAIGKQWVQAEVRQRDGLISWLINGYVIAEHSNNNGFTSGNIMLGNMDPFFGELPDQPNENYAIYDNVRVIDLTTSDPSPMVEIMATDNDASEPGAPNFGTFTLTRTGSTVSPLTVTLRISGTASNGVDYGNIPSTVTFAAGAASTNITVTPINDLFGEPTETVVITLVGKPNAYDIRVNLIATVNIADDGDLPLITITGTDTNVYERIDLDPGPLTLVRGGDTTTQITVNLSIGGTASNGVDYLNIPSSVIVPAGATMVPITVTAINDTAVEGNETVVISVVSGSGYAVGSPSSATVLITDDDLPPATVLFADNFDTNSASNWTIKFGAGDGIDDYLAEFAYDYSAEGIPSAPNSSGGTSKGLKTTVNKDGVNSAAGINLYPLGQNFSGDYALRFNMYLSVGSENAFTTEHALCGINHSGTRTNRHATAGSDGLWFAINGDDGDVNGYISYATANPTAVPSFVPKNPSEYYYLFTTPPWGYLGCPSVETNVLTSTGTAKLWSDVEASQVGNLWSLKVNNTLIWRRTNTFGFTNGTIMVGYMDRFGSTGSTNNYAIFDNVRVVSLAVSITSIQLAGNNVQINFTSPLGGAGDFVLQSASVVTGPYAPDPGPVTISQVSPGAFQMTTPRTGSVRFYRINRTGGY